LVLIEEKPEDGIHCASLLHLLSFQDSSSANVSGVLPSILPST